MGYGCDVMAITESGGYHTKRSERSNLDQELLQHEREKEDRKECRRQKQKQCVCTVIRVCVSLHVRVHEGTLLVGRGQGASCVFRLPYEHPVHGERNRDKRPAMLISILLNMLSHQFTHTHKGTFIHTQGNYNSLLPRSCQSSPSLCPHTDTLTGGEWLVRTFKWLLAGLQREQQES